MRSDASAAAISDEVDKMQLGRMSAMATWRLLKKRAYSKEDFVRMLANAPFGTATSAETESETR